MMLSLINLQFIDSAINNHLDLLKNLLGQGANIHADNDKALRWAADSGQLEIVKYLLSWGLMFMLIIRLYEGPLKTSITMFGKYYQLFFKKKNC